MRMRFPLAVAAALALAAPVSAAASPPPGSLLERFALNQLQNCSVICPYAAQGSVSVPIGAANAPLAFLQSAAGTGDPMRAFGAAALSVTSPANAAMTGIIGNDLNQVVPRFQNGVLITMVDLLRIADGSGSVAALRTNLLAALSEPLPPTAPVPPPLTTPPPFGITPAPVGPVQVAAVRATNVFFAAAFYVPELSLLGATQTADAAASALASTGDPVAAVDAGLQAAGAVAAENARILSGVLSEAGGAAPSTTGEGGTSALETSATEPSPPSASAPVARQSTPDPMGATDPGAASPAGTDASPAPEAPTVTVGASGTDGE